MFLNFSAHASANVVFFFPIFSTIQIASYHLSHHQTTLKTLQHSEAGVVPPNLYEEFRIHISFQVHKNQDYDHVLSLHETRSVHLNR